MTSIQPTYIGGPCCGRDVIEHATNPHVVYAPALMLGGQLYTVRGAFEYALTGTGDYRFVGERETAAQADGGA